MDNDKAVQLLRAALAYIPLDGSAERDLREEIEDFITKSKSK